MPGIFEQSPDSIEAGNRMLDELAEMTDETDTPELWDEVLRNLGVDPETRRGLPARRGVWIGRRPESPDGSIKTQENLAMSSETLDRAAELLEAEHRQRMEYARIEHERRMEAIEAEAAFFDQRCRLLAEQLAPSNARLDKLVGTFKAPPGAFDDEEPCY